MPTRVLFMCPHAAGKSLFAATYFRAAAVRTGIDVEIDVAGPDPDPDNMATVRAALESQGFGIHWHPRLVTDADAQAADIVVSVGCDRGTIPTDGPVTEWNVPLLSEDFHGSMRAIHRHAEQLARDLDPNRSADVEVVSDTT